MTVDILGTTYTIETRKKSEDDFLKNNDLCGYCGEYSKTIVINDFSECEDLTELEKDKYRKETLRHEITHAFLNESGMSANTHVPSVGWAKDEEMVDWIAIQFPKMLEVFKQIGAI